MNDEPIPNLIQSHPEPPPYIDKRRWSALILKRWTSRPVFIRPDLWSRWTNMITAPTVNRLPTITRNMLGVKDEDVIREMGWERVQPINPRRVKARMEMLALGHTPPPLTLEDIRAWIFSYRRRVFRQRREQKELDEFNALPPEQQKIMLAEKLKRAEKLAQKRSEYRARWRDAKAMDSEKNTTGIKVVRLPNGRINYEATKLKQVQHNMPWSRRRKLDLLPYVDPSERI